MGLSTSVLYELIVLANLMLLAVAATIVVGLLRWALSGWASIWLKTIAIHAVNFIVALAAIPTMIGFFPILWFAGLTNGSIIDLCFFFMIADGVRVWAKTQPNLVRHARGLLPSILFFAICGLGLLHARMSVLPDAKTTLEEVRWTSLVYQSLEPSQREVVDAMRRTFPKELDAIMKPYVAQIAAEAARSHRTPALPKFPLDKISIFLKSKRSDLARAPDADLARLAESLRGFADFLTRRHASCSMEPGNVLILHIPNLNQPIQQGDAERFAQLMVAVIVATRAGIDQPVNRDISAARAEEFNMLFRRSLPPKLQGPLDDLIGAAYQPKACDIEVLTAHYRWIGTLPPADAADYLAIQFSGQLGPSLTLAALP
jgi:hypothetical protein